jgi:hypothetical protein
VAVLIGFALLSAAMTFPLLCGVGTHILGAPAPGDNFEYLYKVYWFKHALFDLHVSPFFNASMFYPDGYNVTLSETTLSNTIPALPLTLCCGEVVAYNMTMWLSFVLSGLSMYLLVMHLTGSRAAGAVSGTIFALCPYRMAHLGAGHLPLMGTQWLPLLILYLERMVTRGQRRDAVMAGLFYSLGALSAWYYAYMFALAGLLYVLVRARPWRQHLWQPRFAANALAFVAVCLLVVGPFALPMTQVWSEGDRPQSLRYVDHFSASILDFVYPNVMHPLWGASLAERYAQNINENLLFVGAVPLALAIVALVRRRGHAPVAFALLSLVFTVLALGTTLHWGNTPLYIAVPAAVERAFTIAMSVLSKRLALYPISSYSLRVPGAVYLPLPTLLLYLFLPFFSAMRVWGRFGLVTVFGISVLAGFGLQALQRGVSLLRRPFPAGRRTVLLAAALSALVVLEFAAAPYALGASRIEPRAVDDWLAEQRGDFAILELPMSKALSGRTLYAMRTHDKNIVSGYGTFFPRTFTDNRPTLEGFPDQDSLALLRDWDVRYVLLGANSYGEAWPKLQDALTESPGLRHVVTLDDQPIYVGDRLLRLLPGTEQAFVVDRIHVYEVL